jgi:hypothetical protein
VSNARFAALVLGVVLIVVGAALVYLPAGVILAGLCIGAGALGVEQVDED